MRSAATQTPELLKRNRMAKFAEYPLYGIGSVALTPQRAAQCHVLRGVRVQSRCHALLHDKKSDNGEIPVYAIPVYPVQQDFEK